MVSGSTTTVIKSYYVSWLIYLLTDHKSKYLYHVLIQHQWKNCQCSILIDAFSTNWYSVVVRFFAAQGKKHLVPYASMPTEFK